MRRIAQPYEIVHKFYPMYGLRQTKNHTDADIYDDPAEFYIPENTSPSTRQPSNSTVYSTESLYPNYENIDDFARQLRLSGLTDSGHYSNRSSDVSLSLPSGVQQNHEAQTASNPISECTEHTHENLNRTALHTYPKQYKHQSDARSVMPTRMQNSDSCSMKPLGMVNQSNQKQTKPFQCSNNHLTEHQKPKPKCPVPHISSDTDDLSLHSESVSYSSCSIPLGDLPTHFQNKLDFMKFWEPIFGRLINESELLMQIFDQDSKSSLDRSPGSAVMTRCEFDQDLLLINQLCTFMIAKSKRNLDTGLTRKFVLHRQTLENLGEKFENYWKSFHQPDQLDLGDSKFSIQEVERLFKTVQSELDILGTTILANFSLLFPNPVEKQQGDPHSRALPDLPHQARILPSVDLIPNPTYCPVDLEQQVSNPKPTNSTEANMQSDRDGDQSDLGIGHLKLTDSNGLRSQFYRILSLCDLASDDVQNYLLILLNFPPNDQTGKLLSSMAALNTTTSTSVSSSPSSPTCNTSTATTNSSSSGNTYSHLNHNNGNASNTVNPNNNNSSFALTSQFMIQQTKHILSNCSRLVQLITELCSLIITHEKNQTNQKDDYAKQLSDSRYKLESCGDQICESLKGLITQTKESTRHINSSQLNQSGSGLSAMPVPGPLLQRLIGSVRGVGFALDKIKFTLNQFLENCKS